MIICDVFSLSILTYLNFSQVGKPILDTQACNVTWVPSTSLEAPVPVPVLASPSWVSCLPLFKEPAVSGDDDVGEVVPMTLGRCCLPSQS